MVTEALKKKVCEQIDRCRAMCVIDLLADGAVDARRVKEEFQPRLTKQHYLDLMQRLAQ